MPLYSSKFRKEHLTKKCPSCGAFVGSKCRGIQHGEVLFGTHRERVILVQRAEKNRLKKMVG